MSQGREHLDSRSLARAVRPQEGENGAGWHFKGNVIDSLDAALKDLGQVFDGDVGCRHGIKVSDDNTSILEK